MSHAPRPLLALVFVSAAAALACGGGTTPTAPTAPPAPAAPAAGEADPAGGSGGALARIQKHGHLVVAMDLGENGAGTPPMYFPDAAGKPDGFDYTVARWIATAVGVPDVRLVHGKYAELPEMLRASKEIDVLISGYAPSEEPGITWSSSYLDYGLALVVPVKSPVHKAAELNGQDIGSFADEAVRGIVKRLVPNPRSTTEMQDGYWDALASGRLSGFFYDYPYAVAEINAYYKAHPDKVGAFRFAEYNLSDLHYAVGVRQGEADLLAKVNEAIEKFWESDQYGETIRKYLSGGVAVDLSKVEPGKKTVKVAAGETLGAIAKRELGDTKKWPEIWALNKDRIASPHLINAGDVLILP